MTPVHVIPVDIRRVLARRHADEVALDNHQLRGTVQEHGRYVVGSDGPSRGLAEEIRKAATMRLGEGLT